MKTRYAISSRLINYTLRLAVLLFVTSAVAIESKTDDYEAVRNGIVRFGSVYRELTEGYVDNIDHDILLRAGIDGMLSRLDPYTVFLEKSEAAEFDVMQTGKYGGIGIELGVRGADRELTVMSVFDGQPAARAGMHVGDVIILIDTMKTAGWTTGKASQYLRGDPNTPLVLTIRRTGTQTSVLKFELTRAAIEVREIGYSGMIDSTTGYIKLLHFGRNASRDIARSIERLSSLGMKNCIIDLRQNPGGLLNAAVEISELFLERGKTIVSTRGRDSSDVQEYRSSGNLRFTGPLAILVDEGSASASEIVAGAMQDQDRAVIVGSATFGKGLVQSIRKLPGDANLKITTSKYFTPSGRLIQKVDYFRGVDSIKTKGVFYHTMRGRTVTARGGIVPDVAVAPHKQVLWRLKSYGRDT